MTPGKTLLFYALMSAKKSQPKELITYLCTRCSWDFTRAENHTPICTLCKKKDCLQEIRREPFSPQAVEQGMMRSMERLMTGLKTAYESGKKEGIPDNDEILLLETMVKAKNLEEELGKIFGPRKRGGVHAVSISL